MSPFIGVPIVFVATGLLFATVGHLKTRYALRAESTRKLVHVGVGLIALSFPWTLVSTWLVIGVCLGGSAGLTIARRSTWLGQHIDGIVGVKRLTQGEVYFAATVGLLYLLARGDPVVYVIPLIVLTFADAAAAVVGLHYGVLQYATEEGGKSAEGSLVFFVVAFFGAHIPLLLFTNIGDADCLLIAFLVAFISMLVEAVCTKGFDNVLIPLTTLLVLQSSRSRGTWELGLQTSVACGLLAFVFLTRHRNTLSGSALLGAVLVGYLSWTFGGWQWLLAPLIMFIANAALHIDTNLKRPVTAHSSVVLRVSEAGLVWLFLAAMLDRDELILPFITAFSAHLAMLSMRQLRVRLPSWHGVTIVAASVTIGWVLVFVPFGLLGIVDGRTPMVGLWLLVAVFLSSWLFYRKLVLTPAVPEAPRPWRAQSVCGALASLLVLVPLYLF